MTRTLPIGNPSEAITDVPLSAAAPLAGVIAIYDPAMCCATGVCGPAVDPALLALARDIRWLEKHGVTVHRYGLSQEPQAFVHEPRITGLMQAFGDKALPATLVNGEVLAFGRYPTRDEMENALRAPADSADESLTGEGGGCCAPGSSCC